MINLNAVAIEVFDILRSFDYTVMMYDDAGMEVYEPEEARRLFAKPENLLVSIVDDNDNSAIILYLSGDTDVESVLGLVTSLNRASTKYNMIFKNRKWDRDLSVKDFVTKNSVRESKEPMQDLTEGMFGTSRSSYLKLENARMIVRHSAKIDENITGARSRKVESIFIENAQGERILFPTKQLAPARAMTQHFNNGGNFADEVGQQITQMAQDYSALGQASSFIGMNQPVMTESAMDLREKCRTSRKGIRKCFERLYRESTYSAQAGVLKENAANPVLVEDATLQHLREMLVVEGKELDETIFEAIARCVEMSSPITEDDSKEYVSDAETIRVCGHIVDRAGWESFKQGKLLLRANPESLMGDGPEFRDHDAAIMFKFENIIPLIITKSEDKAAEAATSSIAKFFGDLVEDFETADPKKKQSILTIAKHALEFANIRITEGLGARGSAVIREFEDWLDSMSTKSVLGRPDVTDEDAPLAANMSDIGVPTEISHEVEVPGEEIYSPEPEISVGDDETIAADIANGYTEGQNWALNFPEKEQAFEVIGEKTALIAISNAVLGGSRNGSVHSDPTEGARQSFEWTIDSTLETTTLPASLPTPVMTPPVVTTPPLASPTEIPAEDFSDDFAGDDYMGEEFTREDILLPKNQADDLKHEVGYDIDSTDEFQSKDGEELTLERLRKLSGIKIG